jgi:methyl-CpG-binding domain protein 4
VPDWEKYTLSRMSTPPPASPLDLLQEYYCHDPWRLLVSCALMSRVSSIKVKHACIGRFFAQYPTPSASLDADPQDIFAIIAPLGLFENRLQSLISISQRFLEMPEFNCSLEPEFKMYGIGEFGVDSFRIFCRGQGQKMSPSDRTLASFVGWLKRSAGMKESDDEAE